jgi:hypothetical protein
MHVTAVLDAIKKRGHLDDYKKAAGQYEKAKEAMETADTLEGPRGMLRQSFNNCMMFHLLTVFPINVAEQEKYYITNVLKKPQRVNVHQFVR